MTEPRYPTALAARDLAAAGLLSGVLLPDGRHLDTAAATAAELPGGFLGAGLDSRRLEPDALFVALAGEQVDGRAFAPGAAAAGHWVLTRTLATDAADPLPAALGSGDGGVLLSHDPAAALARLGACWRSRLAPTVLGVTGTNGKTTTKDLLAAALSAAGAVLATAGNHNNALGVPLTLLRLRSHHRFAVIEMGASAVGEIAHLAALAAPRIGVITNASPAHLAEFGSLDGIITGKGELLDVLPADGAAVLNADSPGFAVWRARAVCPVLSWGTATGDHRWFWRPGTGTDAPVLTLDGTDWPVPLPGRHNGANLAAALLAATAAGIAAADLRRGLDAFRGSPHRSTLLTLGGRTVLDDSYNANPASVEAAAAALGQLPGAGRRVAVLGKLAELGDEGPALCRATGGRLAGGALDVLVAVGEEARPLSEGFDAAGGDGHYCATREEAADLVARLTSAGDRILVKGSRSAAMERLLDLLRDRFESTKD